MPCRDVCQKYKTFTNDFKYARYANGQKRCTTCATYLTWNFGNRCPCCGRKLRLKPRNARLRTQYSKILENKLKYGTTNSSIFIDFQSFSN